MHVYQESTITIPTDRNLTELLQSSARFPPLPDAHSIAKDDIENRNLTIGDLRDRAGRLAHGLVQKYHPKDQSRWAVIVPNSIAYVEGCHTVLWLGGIFCPINHLLTVHDMGHALATTKPDFLIVYSEVVDKVVQAIGMAKGLKLQWSTPPLITALGSHPQYPDLCSFLSFTPLPIPHYTDSRQRIASIHLSSGTTGASKGVALTHYNYIANVLQMYQHDPAHFHPSHQVVSYTPFVHIANTTIPLFLGPWTGMVHLIMHRYEMHACLKLVEREKATAMQLAPSMAVAIANTDLAERYDLSSLRHMTVGGLPLTKSLYEKFLSRGKGRWKTVQLYGMTEAAPYVSWQKVDETVPFGTIGRLLPGIQARLCDEDGRDVEVSEKGEMWIKGPNVTSGYIDNAEATQKAFKEAGWYNTGDLCTIDSQGYMSVVGRTKELIKYNGFQVSPADLEIYLNSHPAVGEASVAGTKSKELMTELPTAYIVLTDDMRQKTETEKVRVLRDIQEFVDDKVSGYKKLRGGVWEALELPKNATGKVVRAKLNEFKTGLSSMPKAGVAKL